jgi:2-methylcitrate dehydratase PrpD
VFGMDPAAIQSALGTALSQSAGSLQFLANGAWTKRFQVGWASMSGLAAAVLAREGFKGAAEALEGKHGFLRAYAPSPNPARATERLGAEWELMRTAVKPYPSCRYGHAGIDAAIAFHNESGLDPATIERVTYGTSASGMTLIGEPLAKRQDPQNVVDGQFSGPFVIAAGLLTGQMGWDSYALLHDKAIRALLPRIACAPDPDVQAEFPDNMAGKLTVVAGGRTWERFVRTPKGEPDNFLTDAEVRAKFTSLAVPVLGDGQANRLAEAVLALDAAPNLAVLARLAGPTDRARLAGD